MNKRARLKRARLNQSDKSLSDLTFKMLCTLTWHVFERTRVILENQCSQLNVVSRSGA